jgi:type II secretory pathway pseudopilin PulG
MPRRRRVEVDRGDTLLELLVAITILGVCVVAIGSGIVLSVKMSTIHRNQATANAFLHNYAETLQGSYATCSGGAALPNYTSGLPVPSGFGAPTASISVWDASSARFVAAGACPAADPGLQQVSLTLESTDKYVKESLVVVVRKATP